MLGAGLRIVLSFLDFKVHLLYKVHAFLEFVVFSRVLNFLTNSSQVS